MNNTSGWTKEKYDGGGDSGASAGGGIQKAGKS
jgi:hypothetical protein